MNEPSLHHLVRKEPTCLAIAQVCHSCWLISIIYTFGTRKVSGDERLLRYLNSPSARAAPRFTFRYSLCMFQKTDATDAKVPKPA